MNDQTRKKRRKTEHAKRGNVTGIDAKIAPKNLARQNSLAGVQVNRVYLSNNAMASVILQQNYDDAKPFPHVSFPNFLVDTEEANDINKCFLHPLLNELMNLNYNVKSNDLYDFFQSDDMNQLNPVDFPFTCRLRELLYSEAMIKLVENLTKTSLDKNKVDMSAAIYRNGGYLECHDDKLDSRSVAYIIYLVDEDWSEADGGALELLEMNEDDHESEPLHHVGKKCIPKWNSFTFFKVCDQSYHRVAEVTSSKPRLTISGWYHHRIQGGKTSENANRSDKPDDIVYSPLQSLLGSETKAPNPVADDFENSYLAQFINEEYLKEKALKNFCEYFCDNSMIELRSFLKAEVYNKVLKLADSRCSSKCKGVTGFLVGPPQKQRYYRLDDSENHLIGDLESLFKSKIFAKYLQKITSLLIDKCNTETRYFTNGCYTLCYDGKTSKNASPILDCFFTITKPGDDDKWQDCMSGYVCYVAGDDELLTIDSKFNTLSMVLRDGGVMSFVKRLSKAAPSHKIDIKTCYTLISDESED